MIKKTILITGANGEIGQALVNSFHDSNKYIIIALDLSGNIHNLNVDFFIKGSIADQKTINNIFKKYSIDIIYHLAAILSTKAELNKSLAFDVNVNGSKYLIDAAVKKGKKINFFFPSSIAVYNIQNKNLNNFIKEKNTLNKPLTTYGKNKLEVEQYGIFNINQFFDFRCIRFPGIISATTTPTGGTSDYAPEMIHSAAQNKNYKCFVNSKSQLPFIVMPDAIQAITMLMQRESKYLTNNVYNITSFSPTVKDLYTETIKYYSTFKIIYAIDDERQRIVNSWPNNIDDSKAREEWNWKPQYILKNAYKYYLIPKVSHYYKGL